VTLRAYYRRALLLPIVVPLLFAPGLLFTDRLPLGLGVLLISLLVSPLIGAVPYLIFILLLRQRTRGWSDRHLRRIALVAPLLFAPLLGAVLLPIAWYERGSFWSAAELVVGWCVPFSLVLGYLYVAIAEAGRIVLERRGAIRCEA
jgi:hypothetical protein